MNWVQLKDLFFSHVSCWRSDSIQVCYTIGGSFEPFYYNDKYFLSLNSLKSVKAFRKTQLTSIYAP